MWNLHIYHKDISDLLDLFFKKTQHLEPPKSPLSALKGQATEREAMGNKC